MNKPNDSKFGRFNRFTFGDLKKDNPNDPKFGRFNRFTFGDLKKDNSGQIVLLDVLSI